MNIVLQFLLHYGVIVLFAGVFAQQLGLPAPGGTLLLGAGTLCSTGHMSLFAAILASLLACLIADGCWYQVGRLRGSKQTKRLQPSKSRLADYVQNHAAHFGRHGYVALLLSKFVPGPNMVSMLAGRAGIARPRMVVLDTLASTAWICGYIAVGYEFSTQLQRVADMSAHFAGVLLLLAVTSVVVISVIKFVRRQCVNRPRHAALALSGVLLLSNAAAIAQSNSISSLSLSSPLQRSIPSGAASGDVMRLTLSDALKMSLKYNLGGVESGENARIARGQRLVALSKLLPDVSVGVTENVNQTSMSTLGIKLPGVPSVVGPYSYSSAGVDFKQTLFSVESIQRLRAARSSEQAAQLSYQDTLDVLTLTVGNAYLQVLEASARIDAEEAQVRNAQALYDHARAEYEAGSAPRIDATRTEVQLHSEQYNLSVARNDLAIAKLQLARAIGLPLDQAFELADDLPYADLHPETLEDALKIAQHGRKDLREAEENVKAAGLSLSATKAERYPVLQANGGYADVGTTFGHSHGTFNFNAGVKMEVFTGGKIKGEIAQAEASVRMRKAQAQDMVGEIDYEVRAAFLNLNAAKEQVEVGRLNVDLANENLSRSKDRFTSGVTDSVEVVQSEQALASANNQYIASVYNHNLAKLAIARALGVARVGYSEYLGEK